MRNKLILLLLSALPLTAAPRQKAQGYCEQGGQTVIVNASVTSTGKTMKSYPGCTVTIYDVGTTNLSTIYSDDAGTPKSNPFTADATTGAWFFFADDGEYDVRNSGAGISPTFTRGDYQLFNWKYLSQGSGAVARTVKDKLTDTLSIKDFGAVGNGTTDDTSAVQAAITYAESAGKVLTIPSVPGGCYKITTTLVVTTGLTIRGGYQDGASPQICYYGDPAQDAIKVGTSGGSITFRVVLDGFAVICPTGCDSAVELLRFSEGEVNLTIGNAAYPGTITNGIYCNQCFIGKISSTITTVGTGIWFNTQGPFSLGYIDVRDSNIFETTNGIRVSQGGNLYIENNYVENFDVGLLLDNGCALAGCVINNLVVRANYFVTTNASTHTSPVAISYAPAATPSGALLYGTFTNNLIFVKKNGAGASPYAIKFDISGCSGCTSTAWFSGNSIEGGTTSSFHATGGNVWVIDQGGNYYRLEHLDVIRPNTEIYTGTVQFTRWDYRQYQVYDPSLSGGRTLLTIKAALNQPSLTSIVDAIGADANTDWKYYGRTAYAWQADAGFSWQKLFGYEDPSGNTIYGFGGFGGAGAFSYLFTGSDRSHPWQTWFKATGNTVIGDTVSDSGHKLRVAGTTRFEGATTVSAGYGPTSITPVELRIGAGGLTGGHAVSMAFGDGTGYRVDFGPVLAGTFTPRASITDKGEFISTGLPFASLPFGAANGTWIWCTDCIVATPCAGAGAGAFAFRTAGAWKCAF